MPAVYAETSAVLTWLLGEPRAAEVMSVLDGAEAVVTATLTSVEVHRSLVRAATDRVVTAAARRRLMGLYAADTSQWTFLELTESVRARAGATFPVEPVRSLDAIHLASALEAMELFPQLAVLSFDRRVVDNLEPLGIESALAG